MRSINSVELARMTATAVESLNDTCNLYHATYAQDSDTGELIRSFDSMPSLGISCGFVEASEYKNERGQIITIDADALLRLAATQTVAPGDKVIARAKTYNVDGVTPGRNVQICKLMEVKI